jgi:hypothetical protein
MLHTSKLRKLVIFADEIELSKTQLFEAFDLTIMCTKRFYISGARRQLFKKF